LGENQNGKIKLLSWIFGRKIKIKFSALPGLYDEIQKLEEKNQAFPGHRT
jgi:hypothetical protein